MKPLARFLLLALAAAGLARGDELGLPQSVEKDLLTRHYLAVDMHPDWQTGLPIVQAEINGRTATMTVCIGSETSFLSAPGARHLQVPVHAINDKLQRADGQFDGGEGVATVSSIRLGGVEINHPRTFHVLPETEQALDGVDGIIGLDLLYANAAVIPLVGHSLLIKQGDAHPVDMIDGMARLGFKAVLLPSGGLLRVDAHINGKTFPACLDSGSVRSIFEKKSIASLAKVALFRSRLSLIGVDGPAGEQYYFTPTAFGLGGIVLWPPTLLVQKSPVIADEDVEGVIGLDILNAYNAIIDLPDHYLWLK